MGEAVICRLLSTCKVVVIYLWDHCLQIINYVNTLINSMFRLPLHLLLHRPALPPFLSSIAREVLWSILCGRASSMWLLGCQGFLCLPSHHPSPAVPSGSHRADRCHLKKPDEVPLASGCKTKLLSPHVICLVLEIKLLLFSQQPQTNCLKKRFFSC